MLYPNKYASIKVTTNTTNYGIIPSNAQMTVSLVSATDHWYGGRDTYDYAYNNIR